MAVRALAHFHWAAGARVALRANAVIVGAVVFTIGSAPDGLATLRAFLLGIVAEHHPVGSRGLLAAVCLVLAATGVPRTTLGLTGWLRSLPIEAREVRRATVLALCIAQLAVVVFVPLAALASVVAYRASLSPTKLLAVPLMMLAASMVVLPVKHSVARVLAAVALVASVRAGWLALLIAMLAIAASDAIAGEVVPRRSRASRRRSVQAPRVPRGERAEWIPSAMLLWIRVSWRAIGLRGLVESMVAPLVFVGFAQLMVRNNPDFAVATVERIVRVCGALALAFSSATLANAVLRVRQPWSWARSLPWTSKHRVLADACVLGAPLLMVPAALGPLSGSSAATVTALIPVGALLGASAIRAGTARQTGAAGETLVLFALVGIPVVLWPMLAVAAIVTTPLIFRWAAERERAVRATRWTELQHDVSGDPAWLSAR